MHTQNEIKKGLAGKVSKELQSFDFIEFAILFGSVAEGRATNISDIDIGIYSRREIPLMDIGLVTARCEAALRKKVDVLVLNGLYKKRPVLAYELVTKGQLLFYKNQDNFIEFKKNAFLYYFDTSRLRSEIDKRFKERLESGKFGERNYAGTV